MADLRNEITYDPDNWDRNPAWYQTVVDDLEQVTRELTSEQDRIRQQIRPNEVESTAALRDMRKAKRRAEWKQASLWPKKDNRAVFKPTPWYENQLKKMENEATQLKNKLRGLISDYGDLLSEARAEKQRRLDLSRRLDAARRAWVSKGKRLNG